MGNFKVLLNNEEITQERWVSTKARDLLAYFITMRKEKVPADKVFDAIWGEKEYTSRTAFHTALTRLRNALKTGEDSPRLILVEASEYRLDSARFTIDVDEFDLLLAKARSSISPKSRIEYYEQAANLYHGEYLQNLYYDWIFPERRRLIQSLLNVLQELALFHFSNQEIKQSAGYIERAIMLDSLNEDLYCQGMKAYSALNDRASISRLYTDLKLVLHNSLSTTPLPETTELYQELVKRV